MLDGIFFFVSCMYFFVLFIEQFWMSLIQPKKRPLNRGLNIKQF